MRTRIHSALLLWCKVISGLIVTLTPAMAGDSHVINLRGIHVPPLINDARSGIVMERSIQILECAGLQAQPDILTWRRAFDFTINRHGALIPAIKTPERERQLWYPAHPVHSLEYRFYQRNGAGFSWSGDYDSVKNMSIGKLAGGAVAPEFDDLVNRGALNVTETADFSHLVKMLQAGRIDMAAAEGTSFSGVAKQLGLADAIEPVAGPNMAVQPVYIAFHPTELDADEKQRVNNCLNP